MTVCSITSEPMALAEPAVLPPIEEIRRTSLTVVTEDGAIAAVIIYETYDGQLYVWQDVDPASLVTIAQAIIDEVSPYVEP
jgi:hypothetical protein